ncbi:hypothetical protein T484DRAFT_1782179 [Baffinella frigidus]|nr:hypothetical protein T484DRAFT_1782179 [Cryptophyta sp. CCMP2293]
MGDAFWDLSGATTFGIASEINAKGVHVLIDLDAHFRNSRMHLLAFAPAPLQVARPPEYAAFFTAVRAFAVVTPPEYAPFFSEKLLFLPGTYYVNSHQASLPPPPPPPPPPRENGSKGSGTRRGGGTEGGVEGSSEASRRAEEGLPARGVLIANFNQLYKLDGDTFAIWLQVLKKAGIDPGRIVFARWAATSDEHVRRSALASLSLDTPLYTSMTTACDILWAGSLTFRGGFAQASKPNP